MIHELREYKLKPGKLAEYLDHVDTKVARLRGDRYGRLVAFFRAASGDTERVVHIWEYDSLNARQDARHQLTQNAGWMNEFIASVWPIIEYQHVTFLDVQDQQPFSAGKGGTYLLRRCEAATGRAGEALRVLREAPAAKSWTACRYLSISPDSNAALDLVRLDPGSGPQAIGDAAVQLASAFGEASARAPHAPRAVRVDVLSPVPISPLQ